MIFLFTRLQVVTTFQNWVTSRYRRADPSHRSRNNDRVSYRQTHSSTRTSTHHTCHRVIKHCWSLMVWSHWARTRLIPRTINKSSPWHQWKALAEVWTLLRISVKSIIIVLANHIVLVLVLVQCEHIISLSDVRRFTWCEAWLFSLAAMLLFTSHVT